MSSPTISPTEETEDIMIFFDEDNTAESNQAPNPNGRRRHLRWLLLLTPWLWFPLRGVHPWMEIVAVLIPVLTASAILLTVLVAAFRRSWLGLALAGSLLIFLVTAIALPRAPLSAAEPSDSTRFAAINVARRWFSSNDVGFFIYDQEPGVFFGSELSESHHEELSGRYDNSIVDLLGLPPDPSPVEGARDLADTYRLNDAPSIGVYSDFDIELLEDPIADEVAGGLPGFRVRVDLPEGEVILYALHIPRPGTGSGIYEVGPGEQRDIVDAIARSISAEELPVIVMGDLNVVDRGSSYQHLTSDLWDVMRLDSWAGPTREGDLWHTLLQLRVDHLLISEELCAMDPQAPAVFFTDHRPIQADIGPCD